MNKIKHSIIHWLNIPFTNNWYSISDDNIVFYYEKKRKIDLSFLKRDKRINFIAQNLF